MSVHEVPLPSPPPDSSNSRPMSGLFSRRTGEEHLTSDGLSDALRSDIDSVTRKRVDFHPFTHNILNNPQLSTPDSEVAPSLKSLPPSRDCQPSVRPILKQTQSRERAISFDGQSEQKSPLDTMESLLLHLDNNDRTASIDAYQTITNLIKMYDEPPEQEILQKKMELLQKHIRRDLVVLDVNVDELPSEERLSRGNLVMSALKVLVTMVWSPAYSPCLTDEFRSWAIERAIHVLKEHTASKATLLHYMHLLATQTFKANIMTFNNRIPKVLEVLREMTVHVSGKAVVAERLLVYQKLIEQAKQIMKSRANLWVKNLLEAMGHSFKEVRSNAISCGTKACIAFVREDAIADVARMALSEITGERSLSSSITNRLERVLAAKDEANQIPQIWTIVLMLCNTGRSRVDAWPQLHDWLKLIQRCFNCSDSTVRVQAFMAWNRLYFVAKPHEASEKVVSMLAKPAMVQLDRTGNNQSGKGTRQAVISSYCMLLYYAFRPSATHLQYTRMWNEFVVKLMTRSFLSKSSANCDLSCRILAALFHSPPSTAKTWNENRAHENAPLDPRELPTIDYKWTRSKMPSILSIMRLLVDYSSFGPDGEASEQAYAAQTWRNLMRAVRECSNKEVVASADTKVALTSTLGFLRQMLERSENSEPGVNVEPRCSLLTRIAVSELGALLVLQALEHPDEQDHPLVLGELMRQVPELVESTKNQRLDQGKLYDRCLTILQNGLQKVLGHQQDPEVSADHLTMIELISHVPQTMALEFLVRAQDILILCLQGNEGTHDNTISCSSPQCTFVMGAGQRTLDLIDAVDLTDYGQLDNLLSSMVSSHHPGLRASLLQRWNKPRVDAAPGVFGPQLLGALAAVPKDVSWRLPGISIQTSRSATKANNEHDTPPASRPARKSGRVGIKNRLRHDDSQIKFVSIDSSPPELEEFESQLLTARQKEVRARQNTESAITFADIRSSPSSTRRRAQRQGPRDAATGSPELPTTPTLPQQRANEEDEQPSTPTPKARRALQNHLQPDVPSSPPSVVNGEVQAQRAGVITSSPIKEPTAAVGDVDLRVVDGVEAEIDGHDELVTEMDFEEPAVAMETGSDVVNGDLEQQGLPSPKPSTEPANDGHVESVDADGSSPTSYSDEYDALAASQLSQNLVEQSQSGREDDAEIEETPRTSIKRKRRQGNQVETRKSKRRRSSHEQEEAAELEVSQPTIEDVEMEDCIVVNTDKISSRSASRRGRSSQPPTSGTAVAPGSPVLSQVSHKSDATTPTSESSRSSRRRRSKRKTRSQASREQSPVTQIRVNEIRANADEVESVVADIEVAPMEDFSISELPSLTSEVLETVGEQHVPAAIAEEELADESAIRSEPEPIEEHAEDVVDVVHEARVDIPATATAAVQATPSTSSQGTTMDFDLVSNLQGILAQLNGTNMGMQDLDLATVHSLCFKIGLKTQELAAAQQS